MHPCRLVSMPTPVLNRDIVQYIAEKRDESTNTTYILYSNAPEGIVPHKFGVIRCVAATQHGIYAFPLHSVTRTAHVHFTLVSLQSRNNSICIDR